MFKRMLLAIAFVAALGLASLGTTSEASARGCGYGYQNAYYPNYASYYGGYPGGAVFVRNAYYPAAYPVYYGGFDRHRFHRHRHHRHGGISVSFGF
jgi:hypothetical protein